MSSHFGIGPYQMQLLPEKKIQKKSFSQEEKTDTSLSQDIQKFNINDCTPLQALNFISELQKKSKKT